jgi:enoyl-CoA hydratase/carnithine racemase
MATLRTDIRDGVCILTLDRPPANAIDETLLADLAAGLDAARKNDAVRAVVLTGAGAFFSGGFDFGAPRRDAAAEQRISALYRDAHRKLLALPKPTVAMMNGHAVAGGLVLVLACDYRLGVDGDYRVGLNEVAVGAAFPRTAFEIVRLRLPHARTGELILGAALYPANQALRLGIVDEMFPPDTFESTVLRRATRLAGMPREAYAHAKAALIAEALACIDSETPEEASQTIGVWNAPESRAARARQREKLKIVSRAGES